MQATGDNPTMGGREWLLLLLLALLWGGAYVTSGYAVRSLPPVTVAAIRVGLGAAFLWAMAVATGGAARDALARWPALLLLGLLNNAVPFALIFWGQTRIGSGLAAILNGATPLFSCLLAPVLGGGERLTARRLGGVAVGLAGLATVVGADAWRAAGAVPLAEGACALAALAYALAGIWGRRLAGIPPLLIAAGQTTAAFLLLAPLALLLEAPLRLPWPAPPTLAALLTLGLACTGVAYVIYFRILARAGATNLLLVTLLIPPAALAFGAALLGEAIRPRHLAGLAVIAAGLALIDGRALGWIGGRFSRARWAGRGRAPTRPWRRRRATGRGSPTDA